MIFYKLVAVVISLTTGDVIREYEEIQKPMTAERCHERQMQKGISTPSNGEIKIYECRAVDVV